VEQRDSAAADPSAARVGWELLRVLQESLTSIEETASRILAAQIAGTIALWTTLFTFENGPPRVLAWIALGVLIGSVALLGAFMRPRRVVRFWDRVVPDDLFAARRSVSLNEEARTVAAISATMRGHRDQLERGVAVAVPLGVVALALLAVAYTIEKAWYPP
jgi:hypothetical protein